MAPTRKLLPALLSMLLAACSNFTGLTEQKEAADSKRSVTAGTENQDAAGADGTGSTGGGQAVALDGAGLPSGCSARGENEQLCVTCRPRKLNIQKCGDSNLRSFDPQKQCTHQDGNVACDLGSSELTLDLDTPTPMERLYERMPMMVFGAKVVVGDQMRDDPKELDMMMAAIDIFDKNSVTLFSCDEMTPVIDQIAKAAKDYNSAYNADELDDFKAKAMTSIIAYNGPCRAGEMNDAMLIEAMGKVLKALPPPLGDKFEEVDLTAILATVGSSGSLESLMGALANKDLKTLIGGKSNGTTSSTATAAGTSTETDGD